MNPATAPLIHIVDDEDALRRALAFLLEGAGWQVAAYDSAEAFLSAWTPGSPPGCLILDIRMPMMSGLELQRVLKERDIRLPIIFLTGHADVPMAVQAMRLGAFEFIEKPFKDQLLLDAVNCAVRHHLAHREEKAARRAVREKLGRLSPREMEVARLVSAGLTNKCIAQELDISERTVQVHRLHLMEKLGLHSAVELTQLLLKSDAQ